MGSRRTSTAWYNRGGGEDRDGEDWEATRAAAWAECAGVGFP